MNKVEQVARAIVKSRYFDCEPDAYGNDLELFYRELDSQHMYEAIDNARAAIEAMRKPTEEMIGARFRVLGRGGQAEWQAMIDAALEEGK